MARVVVTGGAGFLGSHLCERLLADGHDVLCVDNYFTGSKRNVAHLAGRPLFELMRHDITFPLYIEADQIGPRNQHLRAAHAPERRPRGVTWAIPRNSPCSGWPKRCFG